MPYRYLEDSATADIAFEAEGGTLEEVFRSAGDATMNIMIESLDSIRPQEEIFVELENPELDMLLFDFLEEFIYHKDAHQLLLRCRRVEILQESSGNRLKAELEGEKLDPQRHEQRVDVKAVTLHQFQLEQRENGWRAHLILDI